MEVERVAGSVGLASGRKCGFSEGRNEGYLIRRNAVKHISVRSRKGEQKVGVLDERKKKRDWLYRCAKK